MELQELIESVKKSSALAVVSPNAADPCPLQSLQLGIAIMLNKPIILLVQRGRPASERLVAISDRIVEIDGLDFEENNRRIAETMVEMGLMK